MTRISDIELTERINICSACVNFSNQIKRCNVTYGFIPITAWYRETECPAVINAWKNLSL